MIVTHVVRQYAPSVGGLEDAVAGLAQSQRGLGIDARIVTLDRAFTDPTRNLAANACIDGVPVRRLPWRGSSRYPLAPAVLAAVRDADLLHVHAIDFFFDFLAVTRMLHRKPLVATTHGGFFHTQRGARLKRLWFNTITRASVAAYAAIVACSDSDAAIFEPLAGDRLVTIENGVNLDKLVHAPQLRLPHRLIYVGRFASHKRIDRLFALLAGLRQQAPLGEWDLVVAGGDGDVPAAQLEAMAAAAGVANQVRFVLRPTTAVLAAELARASIYVCASKHEGFGIAAVEAAAAGVVPALSDIPPFARLIHRLGGGMVFDPDDIEQAVARISTLPIDPATRARICAAAQSYGWRKPADAYLALYADVLARRTLGHVAA